MSIADLSDQLKSLQSSTTVELTEGVRVRYADAISAFRIALEAEHKKLSGLMITRNVGGVRSADQLRNELNTNINDRETGVLTKLQDYIDYLTEFENTVNAAAGKLLSEG